MTDNSYINYIDKRHILPMMAERLPVINKQIIEYDHVLKYGRSDEFKYYNFTDSYSINVKPEFLIGTKEYLADHIGKELTESINKFRDDLIDEYLRLRLIYPDDALRSDTFRIQRTIACSNDFGQLGWYRVARD